MQFHCNTELYLHLNDELLMILMQVNQLNLESAIK